MQAIILCAGLENGLRGWPDDRPLALQRLAGGNVGGHILNQFRELPVSQLTFIVERQAREVAGWMQSNFPAVETSVLTIAPGTSLLQALMTYDDQLQAGELLIVRGDLITGADYDVLRTELADATLFLCPLQPHSPLAAGEEGWWAGVCHFRRAADLLPFLAEAVAEGESSLLALMARLRERGLDVAEHRATMSLKTNSAGDLLYANARLLGLGYGSENAIERSYAEDFTVIPPVFLHETALIENGVIGPFANVEAGARISNSVVRNSLIGEQSVVESAVLDGSLIGDRAFIKGEGKALLLDSDGEQAV